MVCLPMDPFPKGFFTGYSVMFTLAASYKGVHTFWCLLKNTECPHDKRCC